MTWHGLDHFSGAISGANLETPKSEAGLVTVQSPIFRKGAELEIFPIAPERRNQVDAGIRSLTLHSRLEVGQLLKHICRFLYQSRTGLRKLLFDTKQQRDQPCYSCKITTHRPMCKGTPVLK